MIVRKMYKKFLKIIITNLFFILFIFNQSAVSKPIPPGSGEGDVPANILILLDSSASMHRLLTSGEAIDIPGDIVEDEDGNIILSQYNSGGIVKIITDTKNAPVTGATVFQMMAKINLDGVTAPELLDRLKRIEQKLGLDISLDSI